MIHLNQANFVGEEQRRHLSEREQVDEPNEANREEESGHPPDARLLVAPRRVARRVHSGQLVCLLVQCQQRRSKPTCTAPNSNFYM